MKLSGRIALVTGAGRGIGAEVAKHLGKAGAFVLVHYATSERGARAVAEHIRAAGGKASVVQGDVRRKADVDAVVAHTLKEHGRLDILVNNAGIDPRHAFLEMAEEEWDAVIDTNLKGTFLFTQAAARVMIAARYGRIINIGSVHSLLSGPNLTAYAASKGGIHMFTKQVALELAPYGITVNCVSPGAIEVEKYYDQFPGYDRAELAARIPAGRVGFPEDIAPLVAFLASEEAAFITGQNIVVDGGSTSRLAL